MKVKTGVPTLYCMQPKQWSTLPLDTLADIGSKSVAAIARSKYVSYVFDGRDQLRLHGFGCWKAIYIVQPLIMAIWCNMSNPFLNIWVHVFPCCSNHYHFYIFGQCYNMFFFFFRTKHWTLNRCCRRRPNFSSWNGRYELMDHWKPRFAFGTRETRWHRIVARWCPLVISKWKYMI